MREQTTLDKFIMQILTRRAWPFWPPKQMALELAKKVIMMGKTGTLKRCFYKCAHCGKDDFTIKQVQIDHIEPKINPKTGFQGIEDWILRTFVSVDMLQCLCLECHKIKSTGENAVRREVRNENSSRFQQVGQFEQETKTRAKTGSRVARVKLARKRRVRDSG
jgi:hypothetical protein